MKKCVKEKIPKMVPFLLFLLSYCAVIINGNDLDIVTRNSNTFLYKGQMVSFGILIQCEKRMMKKIGNTTWKSNNPKFPLIRLNFASIASAQALTEPFSLSVSGVEMIMIRYS